MTSVLKTSLKGLQTCDQEVGEIQTSKEPSPSQLSGRRSFIFRRLMPPKFNLVFF